jgi:hypothetical protein
MGADSYQQNIALTAFSFHEHLDLTRLCRPSIACRRLPAAELQFTKISLERD